MKKQNYNRNRETYIPLIIVGCILALALLIPLLIFPYFGFYGHVPSTLLEKSKNRTLEVCTKGSSKVYIIGYHTGFGGTLDYYTQRGRHIGSEQYEDYYDSAKPPPPVDTTDYKCTPVSAE